MDGGCRVDPRSPCGALLAVCLGVLVPALVGAQAGPQVSAAADAVPVPARDRQSTGVAGGDGRQTSIWTGVYTNTQAARGQAMYKQACAHCHADDLLGEGQAPALVGQPFAARWSNRTVSDILQIVRRTMPQESPDSLGTSEYLDVLSYIFKVQGIPAGASELFADGPALRQIVVTDRPGGS